MRGFSTDRVAAEIDGGAILVFQRVPPAVNATAVAETLGAALKHPVRVAEGLDATPDISVLDMRSWPGEALDSLDERRGTLVPPGGARIILLDVNSATELLRRAPHTTSFAGGVAMPGADSVRPALTPAEVEIGDKLLRRWAVANPEKRGVFGIDLGSERVFAGRSDASPVEQAREHLDEGIVYVGSV